VLRFRSLGSGSTGNATVVEAHGLFQCVRVLIDCGLGIRQLNLRLAQAGLAEADIDAVFITHEHSDHIGCAHTFAARHQVPVWMSQGTYQGIGVPDFGGMLRIARDGDVIDLAELQLAPFTVPHDAREPLQLSCTDGSVKLSLLTDLGHATAHVLGHIAESNALMLECNHDIDLLARSTYPYFLKQRVGGLYGHLSNAAAQEIAIAISHSRLTHVVAAHLSEQNNHPDLARGALLAALAASSDVSVAHALTGTDWIDVSA
jgi:phosphoribosyl 1,2-cyclic phosphodiesterase